MVGSLILAISLGVEAYTKWRSECLGSFLAAAQLMHDTGRMTDGCLNHNQVYFMTPRPVSRVTTSPLGESLMLVFVLCRNKRKAEALFSCMKKKLLLPKRWPEAENIERATTETETSTRETKGGADGDGDPSERDASTQTSALSLDQRERVTNLQRLLELEKEVRKIRRLLGLPVHRTTQGTMTTLGKTEDAVVTPSSREMGCQTDTTMFTQVRRDDDLLSGLYGTYQRCDLQFTLINEEK